MRALDYYFDDYPAHEDQSLALFLVEHLDDGAYWAQTQLGWTWRLGEAAGRLLSEIQRDLGAVGSDKAAQFASLCAWRPQLAHLAQISPMSVLEYAAASVVDRYEDCVAYTLTTAQRV